MRTIAWLETEPCRASGVPHHCARLTLIGSVGTRTNNARAGVFFWRESSSCGPI
jgi:hypothetical protein